jgi:hypothetical protein
MNLIIVILIFLLFFFPFFFLFLFLLLEVLIELSGNIEIEMGVDGDFEPAPGDLISTGH